MKQYIYYVYHEIKLKNGFIKGKEIGYFSTKRKAKKVVKKYKKFDGFRDYPNCFHIKKIQIDKLPKKIIIEKYV